jgi:hypothetical protein
MQVILTTLFQRLFLASCLFVLAACGTNLGHNAPGSSPKDILQFIDLQSFDRDLATSLAAPLPKVNVYFFDRISPSALPERLQHWMAAVEAGGGKVKITPAKSTVTAKTPFLLISAFSSLWNASKLLGFATESTQLSTAKAYDAQIVLKADDSGASWIDQVVFTQRSE